MKKVEHKESQIQGSKVEFAEITAGIQMTMLLRMANSFNLPAISFFEEVTHETHTRTTDVQVKVAIDAQGKGNLTFTIEGEPASVWKMGGIYAFRPSDEQGTGSLQPHELLTCLNLALIKLRARYGEPSGQ